MKIHFDNVARFGTGPGTFARRLGARILESGHELVDNGPDADVSLVFIEPTGQQLAKKVVQRLDGIWFKPNEFSTKNVKIRALYNVADRIVFQSQFDHSMTCKWFGMPLNENSRCEIIHNGIDRTPVKEITIRRLAEMVDEYEQIYVCSSNWHAQKRLAANVELFEKLRVKHPNSCLIVLGAHPDARATGPHVFYAGIVEPDVYNQIYSAANWMLHLAWADHCPNVVIEALAQGTPVVCSEVGGTKELVGSYGVVLKEEPYNYELYDYDNPPKLDLSQIDDLPNKSSLDYSSIADIDINSVTDRYLRLFESLIKL